MAQKKAEALAEAGGKTIAGVARVEEAGYYPQARYSSYNSGAGKSAAWRQPLPIWRLCRGRSVLRPRLW